MRFFFPLLPFGLMAGLDRVIILSTIQRVKRKPPTSLVIVPNQPERWRDLPRRCRFRYKTTAAESSFFFFFFSGVPARFKFPAGHYVYVSYVNAARQMKGNAEDNAQWSLNVMWLTAKAFPVRDGWKPVWLTRAPSVIGNNTYTNSNRTGNVTNIWALNDATCR